MPVAKADRDDYVPSAMALADRTYMRSEGVNRGWSLTYVLLGVNILVFLAEYANGRQSHEVIQAYGALSLEGVKHGFLWQFLTYQFLHGGLPHLVLNSLALYFFGRPLEEMLSKRAFLKLYLLSGLAGGIVQVSLGLISPQFGLPMVGASAGICGLIAAFALLNPESTIYIGFFLPIRAKYFLPLMIALSLVLLLTSRDGHVAHAAHLGGTLFGAAYIRWLGQAGFLARCWQQLLGRRPHRPVLKVRFPNAGSWHADQARRQKDTGPTDFISKEVDPILEKISAYGIHSLTERERKILEAARARMEKR
jgi:membrane associated rhomboid family serine protease